MTNQLKKRTLLSLFSMLLVSLFFLNGCASQKSAQDQLKTNTNTILTDIQQQKKNLKSIQSKMEKNQESFSDEQKKFPNKNLLTTKASRTYQNVTERQKDYLQFKDVQTQLKNDRTELIKIGNQPYPGMPKQSVRDLDQSLHLSALDQKTFVTFMDELNTAEETYYDLLSQSTDTQVQSGDNTTDADTTELAAQENRLNQYYGAVFQQIEIMNVNLNTAQKQARHLQQKV